MAQFIKLYEKNSDEKKIFQIVEELRAGAVIIYPTDTVYGLGCDIFNARAVERIKHIKGITGKKSTNLSFICHDLSQLSEYTRGVTTPVFKLMKRTLPGPYTYILQASSRVPKILDTNKKTVGIRVPDHNVPRLLVKELGRPIITTSLNDEDEILEYTTDPELIFERYEKKVDIVIDCGFGGNIASTIIDCTGEEPSLVREGLGQVENLW